MTVTAFSADASTIAGQIDRYEPGGQTYSGPYLKHDLTADIDRDNLLVEDGSDTVGQLSYDGTVAVASDWAGSALVVQIFGHGSPVQIPGTLSGAYLSGDGRVVVYTLQGQAGVWLLRLS